MATATKTTAAPAKTGTYTVSTSSVATPGTSSAANKTLQQSLIAKGAKISDDGKYGPATAAAVAQYGGSSTPTTTNPVTTSGPVRAEVSSIDREIKNLKTASAADVAEMERQRVLLAERRTNEIAGIKTEFDIEKQKQELGQASDYASRATTLTTSGGGFLGATQSQEGVLQNLKSTHDTEKNALMAKREAAILAAQTAYEDKDFAYARELTKEAKDLQKEIYQRTKDFADKTLALSKNKVESFAVMSDEEFAKQSPSVIAEIDKQYYPGYTAIARNIAKKAQDVKTKQDAVNLDKDILGARLQMPMGQKFTLGGQTYTGLKKADGDLSVGEKEILRQQKIGTLFSPGYTIPGTTTPIIDINGYATPEGWKAVIKASGMSRQDFIKQYGNYVHKDSLDAYGLTPVERELIQGKI